MEREQKTGINKYVTDFARVLCFHNANITVPSSYRDDVLTSEEVAALLLVYQAMYPEEPNITFGDLHITIKNFLPSSLVQKSMDQKLSAGH